MSKRKHKSENTPAATHPGSSAEDAKRVGGKGDFGVPESDVRERTYTSTNTKRSDPGGAPSRSASGGSRESGAGGNNSGAGSSSGGDLDTDITGVGFGGGVAASGKIHEPPGPDDATGTSRDFASGPPAKGMAPPARGKSGSTVQTPDDRTVAPGGADMASNSDTGDDAFAGEVSTDEASGRNDAGG
ncbi:MAG TPA: hypothetical protein VG326_18145 [Tepidisphaeraceae bacterium]|nr:hypothetical protein [Tepidisphaeraceae bacterium]